jgi:hypothetical protein
MLLANDKSNSFWILLRAVKEFVKAEGGHGKLYFSAENVCWRTDGATEPTTDIAKRQIRTVKPSKHTWIDYWSGWNCRVI